MTLFEKMEFFEGAHCFANIIEYMPEFNSSAVWNLRSVHGVGIKKGKKWTTIIS